MLKREDDHVLRMALQFDGEGQREKEERDVNKLHEVEEESMKMSLSRKDALC